MKSKVIIIVAVIALIAVVAGFFSYPYLSEKEIQETIGVNFDNVDKVTIASGSTGKSFDIVGKENLQEFFDLLKGAKLKKSFDQRAYTGFTYSAILYKSGKDVSAFNFGYDRIDVANNRDKITRYISSKNIDKNQIFEIAKKYKLNN